MSKRSSGHDFKRDGSRTAWKRKVGSVTFWLEESAAWHVYRSAHYGIDVHRTRADSYNLLTISAGRWSANACISERLR